MKKLLFTILTVLSAFIVTNSQTGVAAAGPDSVRFSFPSACYKDSAAFSKAIPRLAEQITKAYTEPNKRTYFENSINYYALAGSYKKAADLVDSIQKIDEDKSYGIDIRSYALARISEQAQPGTFEKVFKKEFSDAFSQLSFRKKVNMALFDSATMSYFETDYQSTKEKLQANHKDSLRLEDARSLADKFFYSSVYARIIPLMPSLIDGQYRQTFPAIKKAKWAGVVPVQGVDEIPDPTMQYKLLFELSGFAFKGQDSTAKKEMNAGLTEVARQINLHEAAGIPRKNIDVVVVVHAQALDALLTDEKYKKKYGIDNPNIPLIRELQDYGVKLIVCGQAMTYFRLEQAELVPGIRLALTAQTVISSYQLKNYVYHDLSLRE